MSYSDLTADSRSHTDSVAWTIVRKFATTEMSLPDAETELQAHLGDRYVDSDWRPALSAVMEAEGDVDHSLSSIHALEQAANRRTGLKLWIPARPQQISNVETDLMKSVNDLKARNRIIGPLLTIDEILDPAEERETADLPGFPDGDGLDKAIADKVRHEVAVKNGDAADIDSDDDAEGDDGPSFTRTQLLDLCQQLEIGCMQHGDPQSALHLSSELRIFRAKLRREELLNAKQTSIDSYFKV